MKGIIWFTTLGGKKVTLTARHISSYEEIRVLYFWYYVKVIMTNKTVYRLRDNYQHFSEVVDPLLKN